MAVHTFGKYTCRMEFLREKYGMACWDYEFKLGEEVIDSGYDRRTIAFDEKKAIIEMLNENLEIERILIDEEGNKI